MKKSRYTDSQILSILKQNEAGMSVPDLCREHGMSDVTFYNWRAKYGGMDASLMKRLKELKKEAVLLGADAIISVDFNYCNFTSGGSANGSMPTLVVTGTAVKADYNDG